MWRRVEFRATRSLVRVQESLGLMLGESYGVEREWSRVGPRGSGHGEKRFRVDIVDAMRVIQNLGTHFHTREQTQASTRARL